jgi:thymidine kinase
MALLRYISGAMYAGKSSRALQLLMAEKHVHKIIVCPTAKQRGFISRKVPLSDLPPEAQVLAQITDIDLDNLPVGRSVIFVDEVQFMDDEAFWQLITKAKSSPTIDLILAGIHYDQHGKLFANYQQIKSLFTDNQLESLYATCATCSSPDGVISVRKWKSPSRFTDEYAVLCYDCFQQFFYKKPKNPLLCHICQSGQTKQQLRKWKHECSLIDEYSHICSHCYHYIINYGQQAHP